MLRMAETEWVELTPSELEAFCREDTQLIGDDDIGERARRVEAAGNAYEYELPPQARREVSRYIIDAGFRVERLDELIYVPCHTSRPGAAASCDYQARRVAIHDPFFLEGAARRFMMTAHELGHLDSVNEQKNAWMFGGEAARIRAAGVVRRITKQCEASGGIPRCLP